jgi:magnesium-transporting ATPase (P-type)
VKECKDSGINVKMITGDHHLTAFYIGKQLGIVENLDQVTTGKDLEKYEKKGNEVFDNYIKNIQVFARVSPMQKHAIVESMKRQGNFVSVTGDGVNDVLALKEAHIGITVGSGADVAKETADMIIADDKFSSIATGIEEGKKAYNNVRNIVYLLMSTGICEVILYFLSIIFNLSFPLTGVQFLWLNLVTNGIQSNVFAFEKNQLTQYNKKIRKTNENIFNRLLLSECFVATIYIGITGFILYFLLIKTGMDVVMARTYLLTFMVFMESAQAFNCRNEYVSAFKCKFKNNPVLVITILLSFMFQILALYIAPISGLMNIMPINLYHVILMACFSISQILLMEVFKTILRKKNFKKQ